MTFTDQYEFCTHHQFCRPINKIQTCSLFCRLLMNFADQYEFYRYINCLVICSFLAFEFFFNKTKRTTALSLKRRKLFFSIRILFNKTKRTTALSLKRRKCVGKEVVMISRQTILLPLFLFISPQLLSKIPTWQVLLVGLGCKSIKRV